jgi:hypothetical protein
MLEEMADGFSGGCSTRLAKEQGICVDFPQPSEPSNVMKKPLRDMARGI